MIGKLQGSLDFIGDGFIILMACGVGYKVLMAENQMAELEKEKQAGRDTSVWIETVVREDAFILIGFTNRAEQDMFVKLTGVSGIGPKLALAILGSFTLPSLSGAIAAGDSKTLSTAPGVGKKVAERIIVELKGKVFENISVMGDGTVLINDALDALEALGYKRAGVLEIVQNLAKDNMAATVQSLIKLALKVINEGK